MAKQFYLWYFFSKGTTFKQDFWFRSLQKCKERKIVKYTLGVIVYFIQRHYEYKYGIHINSNIQIDDGLCVVHGGSIYLNCQKIGRNFTVYPSVMLGLANGGIPLVGNNVTIYTGAVLAGNIHIGDDCIIGANSVVTKDCEAGWL